MSAAISRLAIVGLMSWAAWSAAATHAWAEPVVPGTGEKAEGVGDDFEDESWSYTYNMPKSSKNLDGQMRLPAARSSNNRWFESTFRGGPDLMKRVSTPDGGLLGSEGALMVRTLNSGVPSRYDGQMQQDDFIGNTSSAMGGYIPASWRPSAVVRVYLPPFDQWENRMGSSFALRLDCRGRKPWDSKMEAYWPGIFIQFSNSAPRQPESAILVVRGRDSGQDFATTRINEPGWWTLGMSVSPDGQIHYYARPGVDDLRAEDRLASHYAYGFRCERFQNFFFNVVNANNGQSWSTAWIIDDPAVYFASRPRAATTTARSR